MEPRHTTRQFPDHRKAARDYLHGGKNQFSALAGAGYSPKQAKKGFIATLKSSGPLREAMKDELHRWNKVAEILPSPEVRANLVRVRLVMNLLTGKDAGVQSAKLLGQDREVAMWESEQPAGIAISVSNCPSEWRSTYILDKPDRKGGGNT
ncbi:MAG: hypothetical protein EPN47_10230 [Acidobacteria bacterium]|nr:MAG: hypothetical protein EPN47_10230 [Acidobacteriota bacterium]